MTIFNLSLVIRWDLPTDTHVGVAETEKTHCMFVSIINTKSFSADMYYLYQIYTDRKLL